MTIFKEAVANTSKGSIRYFAAGQGKPLLFLHAAGGMRFTAALERLADTHFVVMPVLPGFDETPVLGGVESMPALAASLTELADQVAGSAVAAGGQAIGAQLAAWMTLVRPDAVSALVLESPNGFYPVDGPPPSTDPVVMKKQMYAHPENLPPETKTRETLIANAQIQHRYTQRQLRDTDLIARLGEIRCPTLLLYGMLDGRNPIETVRLAHERIAGSRLLTIEDCAHNVEVDQREIFVNAVTHFLSRGLSEPMPPMPGVTVDDGARDRHQR